MSLVIATGTLLCECCFADTGLYFGTKKPWVMGGTDWCISCEPHEYKSPVQNLLNLWHHTEFYEMMFTQEQLWAELLQQTHAPRRAERRFSPCVLEDTAHAYCQEAYAKVADPREVAPTCYQDFECPAFKASWAEFQHIADQH